MQQTTPTSPSETPTLRLERAAHLARYYASRDPFKSGYWEGAYRAEQERLRRLTSHVYEVRLGDYVPDAETAAGWESQHRAEDLAAHAAASRAADRRDRATWQWARTRDGWRDHPDSWVIPKRADLERGRRYTRAAYQRAAQARRPGGSGLALAGQHRRAPITHRRAPRRSSSSSRTSSPDPGEPDDGDPPGDPTPPAEGGTAEPLCLCGCGESLAGRKADCEFVDDTHSKRFRRREKRLAASRPSRQPVRLTPPKVDAGQIAAKVDAVAEQRRDAQGRGDRVKVEELTKELRDLYARRRREDLGYFCTCQSALPDLDEDGQAHCIVCGRPTDSSPPVNGSWTSFRDHRAEMETTADGQRYKRPQHRLLAKRRAEAESSPRVSA